MAEIRNRPNELNLDKKRAEIDVDRIKTNVMAFIENYSIGLNGKNAEARLKKLRDYILSVRQAILATSGQNLELQEILRKGMEVQEILLTKVRNSQTGDNEYYSV